MLSTTKKAANHILFVLPISVLISLSCSIESNLFYPNKPWMLPPCPDGWVLTPEPRSCVSDLGLNKTYTWEDGNEECRRHGSDLVSIENQEVHWFIVEYIHRRSIYTVWLALTDEGKEGHWVWDLGETVKEAGPISWATDHPIRSRGHNCAIQGIFKEGWKSVSCNELHSTMCETQSIIPDHVICKTGFKVLWYGSVKCVVLLKDKVSRADAKKKCKKMNGFLLTIYSKNVAKDIEVLGEVKRPLTRWIGLRRRKVYTSVQWYWNDDTRVQEWNELWEKMIPNILPHMDCVYLSPKGKWLNTKCDMKFFILCQKKVRRYTKTHCKKPINITPCPKGWTLTPNPRTCITDLGLPQEYSWTEASEACSKQGAELLKITNKETNDFVQEYNNDQSFLTIWLSLSDQAQEGKWVWNLENGTTRASHFNNWAWNHPNNGRERNCAVRRRFDEKWRSVSCNERHVVVCEFQVYEAGKPVAETVTRVRYDFERMTWAKANRTCNKRGGRIFSFQDKKEWLLADVFTATSPERWIGLRLSEGYNDTWEWPKGQKISAKTYMNWAPGAAPPGLTGDRCVLFRQDGTWMDRNCTKNAFFICQKPTAESCKKPTVVTPCPEGWTVTPEPRSCISDLGLRHYVTWNSARGLCLKHNSDLAMILSYKVLIFMQEYILDRSWRSVWLSLTDEKTEGKWVWDFGNGSTKTAKYMHWAPGHPIKGREKNCAVQRSYEEGWKSVSCSDNYTVLCVDPKDYLRKTKFEADVVSWSDAKKICKQWKLHLLTLTTEKLARQADVDTGMMISRWLGLRRSSKDGKMRWTNSFEPAETGHNMSVFGFGDCAFVSPLGVWNMPCHHRSFLLCQKPARDRARNVLLQVRYHRADQAVFMHQPLEMTCTADDSRGPLFWTIQRKNKKPERLWGDSNTNTWVLVENEDGLCINRTVSNLVINATKHLQGAQFSCFAGPQETVKKCDKLAFSDTSCCFSPPTKLWVGPRAPPELYYTFDGKFPHGSNLIEEDKYVLSECNSEIAVMGDITWVFYFPNATGPVALSRDHKFIIGYSERPGEKRRPPNKYPEITSRVYFKMTRDMSGLSFACFSYDLRGYQLSMECKPTNPYCVKTVEIITFSKSKISALKGSPTSTGVGLGLGMLVVNLSVVFVVAKIITSSRKAKEGDGRVKDWWDTPSQDGSLNEEKRTDV